MLYAQVFVAIISVFSGFLEYQLLSDYQEGVYTSQEKAVADAEANDQRQLVVELFYFLVFIVSGFLILKWIHRANYNAHQLGAQDMVFTPGWSIGYYFIPFFALWKPYQAMKEIWQASHNPSDWGFVKKSQIVSLWWFLWITTSLSGHSVLGVFTGTEELPELMNLHIVTQALNALAIPLALVFLAIVNSIYQAQAVAYESANKASKCLTAHCQIPKTNRLTIMEPHHNDLSDEDNEAYAKEAEHVRLRCKIAECHLENLSDEYEFNRLNERMDKAIAMAKAIPDEFYSLSALGFVAKLAHKAGMLDRKEAILSDINDPFILEMVQNIMEQ